MSDGDRPCSCPASAASTRTSLAGDLRLGRVLAATDLKMARDDVWVLQLEREPSWAGSNTTRLDRGTLAAQYTPRRDREQVV